MPQGPGGRQEIGFFVAQGLLANLTHAFQAVIADIRPDTECPDPYCWGEGHVELSQEDAAALPAYGVFLALVRVGGFPYAGHSEKIKWSIPVTFKGSSFVLTHLKFGFRVYPAPGVNPSVTNELIKRLRHAVSLVDGLIQPFAAEQVTSGNITIGNRYGLFRRMYVFLRERAEEAYKSSPPPPEAIRTADGRIVGWRSQPFRPAFEGFFLGAPALDAYFSALEHLLILLLPFAGFKTAQDNLVEFVLSSWAAKYKRIVEISADSTGAQIFHALRRVRRDLRNPVFHGGVDESAKHILHFHVPGLGAVPLSVSRYRHSIHYSLIPMETESFEEVCRTLDQADDYLRNGPMRLAVKYAESGLDVAFDKSTLLEYASGMQSDEAMEEYIEGKSREIDRATNMDW